MTTAFEVIPAIDLLGGQVVRLRQGKRDEVTVYSDDPVAFARDFTAAGARHLHVVDLDGAFDGAFRHLDALARIRRETDMRIELGGGVRSREAAEAAWQAGVDQVIVGTRALEDRAFIAGLLADEPARVIVGVDMLDGMVATRGWVEKATVPGVDFVRQMAALGCRRVIVTDVSTDGMMTGPNHGMLSDVAAAAPGMEIIASGGVRSVDDMLSIRALGIPNIVGAITGKALYEGRIDLAQAVQLLAPQ